MAEKTKPLQTPKAAAAAQPAARPTIGRIVAFVAANGLIHAAVISKVRSDTLVDLCPFYHADSGTHRPKIVTCDLNPAKKPETWHWPTRE